ncbi:MAG: DUF1801 domain-containing protein [Rhodobacteraceae bacterium]|nr:DUF1801 domain-containing protein [Paracoccaceae bacterium]
MKGAGEAAGRPGRRVPKRPLPPLAAGEVRLLAGGNPQIAKGDGEGPVRAWIAAMPGWKRATGAELDALVAATVPGVLRAVRWNRPFYGVPGRGWFLAFGCLERYVKVAFLRGGLLSPPPPVASAKSAVRCLHLFAGDAPDSLAVRDWIRQAAAIEGERLF